MSGSSSGATDWIDSGVTGLPLVTQGIVADRGEKPKPSHRRAPLSRGDRNKTASWSGLIDHRYHPYSRLSVEPTVRDLVDARLPRPRRVTLSDCKQYKRRP